ncbi:MAG TPA: hypothetical protein VHQ42_04325 [Candidatus Limnocylindria bacterium]|nr:hypothetical protein [Candidatus Limnocylindria bacterium]
MNPITALMLSQAVEEDRRRELKRRRHLIDLRPATDEDGRRESWLDRLRTPRLSPSNG